MYGDCGNPDCELYGEMKYGVEALERCKVCGSPLRIPCEDDVIEEPDEPTGTPPRGPEWEDARGRTP
jgi:hypothetical protein